MLGDFTVEEDSVFNWKSINGSQVAKWKVNSLHVPPINFIGYKQLVYLFSIIL